MRYVFLDRLFNFIQYYGITYKEHSVEIKNDAKVMDNHIVYYGKLFIFNLHEVTEQSYLVFKSLEEDFKKYMLLDIEDIIYTREYYNNTYNIHIKFIAKHN